LFVDEKILLMIAAEPSRSPFAFMAAVPSIYWQHSLYQIMVVFSPDSTIAFLIIFMLGLYVLKFPHNLDQRTP
jgi:hypothetical protein